MNILVPHSWLQDYIKSDASVQDISEMLSLHAFSVESVSNVEDDPIYNIEITPNRGDALSILGVARELRAILPYQGFDIDWEEKKFLPKEISQPKDTLEVEIRDPDLVPRFSAVVLDKVEVKDSPEYVCERLQKVGIRPINNVVDITNYVMADKGQPMHAFDYDKIAGQRMVLRESKTGEKITTIDGVEHTLPKGVIVIEDGSGELIDLCGIMGGQNTEVDQSTNKILLFVQVYDPVRIRKASMSLGHRTDAALRFEKGIDIEGVIPSLWSAVDFLYDNAGAEISSELIDIVNGEWKAPVVPIEYSKINKMAGVEIEEEVVDQILLGLGFDIDDGNAVVPSWRYGDILIPEDIAEEVIRIYGYHKLPDKIPEGAIPLKDPDESFYWERFVKNYLKYQGFYECYTYSATSKELAGADALPLENPLTSDFAYLRTSLLPQLKEVVEKNRGFKEQILVFEIDSTYHKKLGKLPAQPLMLALVVCNVEYLVFKGIVEALFKEMGIKALDSEIKTLDKDVYGVEIFFESLVENATRDRNYVPISSFNSIKEDLTIEIHGDALYPEIEALILSLSRGMVQISFKELYQNNLTLSLEYFNPKKQITGDDVTPIREKIIESLEKNLEVSVKTAD